MNDVAPTAPRRARWRLLVPLVLASGVALAGWFGWQGWQARQQQAQERALDDARQIDALGQRMDTLRGDLRAQGRLLQDAAASNRVLRDEVLGLGQRNALLEEAVARLDANAREGHQALRLDETELLLVLGVQRLEIAGYGFAPLQLPPDLNFAALFHGVDERVPVEAVRFGTRVLRRLLEDC